MEGYAGKQLVGIDLHRRRKVIVRTTEGGEVLETVRIVNDVERLASVMARAGECPEVVLEATYGWYWARCVAGCRLLLQRRKRRVRCRRDGHQTNTGRRAHPQLATPGPRARHLRQVQARLGLRRFPPPDGLEIDAIDAPGDGVIILIEVPPNRNTHNLELHLCYSRVRATSGAAAG